MSNRYTKIIEKIFFKHYREGKLEVPFEREDINRVAKELRVKLPKNLGDVLYSFRYRTDLPESIRKKAPQGMEWIIRPLGRSIAAQFMDDKVIALFEFEKTKDSVAITLEKHYRLVPSEQMTSEDLENYRARSG